MRRTTVKGFTHMLTYDAIWTTDAVPFASAEEERATIATAQAGDQDATMRVIAAYTPALRSVVGRYSKTVSGYHGGTGRAHLYSREDLRAAALEGLLRAIAAYNPKRHARLSAIAKTLILESVSETAAQTPAGFAIPTSTLKRFFSILRQAEYDFAEAIKLADQCPDMSAENFIDIFNSVNVEGSTTGTDSRPDAEEDATAKAEGRPLYGDYFASVAAVEQQLMIEEAFKAVNEGERRVTRLAYGFEGYGDPMSDAEVAYKLGISRPKAQRTRTAALTKMRAALTA